MDNLEDQLNQLLAQSDRVSAELKREIYLVERADAAISYLRAAREKTAHEVAQLLSQRSGAPHDVSVYPPLSERASRSETASRFERSSHYGDIPPTSGGKPNYQSFGPYDPKWPGDRSPG